ncbi:MAG: MarR family winged helix-turn-helix transcriptional regulator [Geodermatophilaceae bacterium]
MGRPTNLRLDDQLCFALYAATNAVTRAYRPLLEQIGLTYPQYLVMLVLWQDGGHAVKEIAARLALPAHAVSPMIERLESAGLVVRRRAATDRRVVHVQLTAAGVDLEAAAARAQATVACRTQLGPLALDDLRDELHDLVERMGTGVPPRTRPGSRGGPAYPHTSGSDPRSDPKKPSLTIEGEAS